MIKTRDDLQDCLDKDKRALGVKKSRPSIIGDEVWKFEIALRMDEFYRNTQKNKLAGLFWKWRHKQLGLKLGFSIIVQIDPDRMGINFADGSCPHLLETETADEKTSGYGGAAFRKIPHFRSNGTTRTG